MTKESFIVYSKYTVLQETTVNSYNKREARIIVKARMKNKGYFEPKIMSIVSRNEDQTIGGGRDNPAKVVG